MIDFNNLEFYKVISSSDIWYFTNDFDNTKYDKFFEFALVKKDIDYELIESLKTKIDKNNIKYIKMDGVNIYLYSIYPLIKYGRRYIIENSVLIDEETYKLALKKHL